MTLLFALTLFLSAFLLFTLQPLFGKLLLPLLGGSPTVWNGLMAFFQTLLFAGYLYAHVAVAKLQSRHLLSLHTGLLFLALFFLPIGLPKGARPEGSPLLWLLSIGTVAVGLPFFVLATTAPLLQKWYAWLKLKRSHDPYFLYAASNSGSLLALLSYPLLIEPQLRLSEQRLFWSGFFALFVLLVCLCSLPLWKRDHTAVEETPIDWGDLDRKEAVLWLLLAAVPSSLLLGITYHLTTDVAAVPLLWLVPLALYLLTFILVFSRLGSKIHPLALELQPVAVLLLLGFAFLNPAAIPFWLTAIIHLLTFFLAALVCHGELARRRPSSRHLTHYYLAIALGGMLGGWFNVFLAPLLFNSIAEYPLMIVAALLLRPWPAFQWKDLVFPLSLLFLAGLTAALFDVVVILDAVGVALLLLIGATYALRFRPLAYGLSVGVLLFLIIGLHEQLVPVVMRVRTFFGVLTVRQAVYPYGDQLFHFHELWHGTTKHGAQYLCFRQSASQCLDANRLCEPLTYYSRPGPMGQFFEAYREESRSWQMTLVGLGTGALVSFAQPDQKWQFFELDPEVIRIALDPRYFRYLTHCHRSRIALKAGDGRLLIEKLPDHSQDLIVLDAFSSDAIPIHLLTLEALDLYLQKLKPDGFIAFHVTNRHLDVAKMVARLAWERGLAIRHQNFVPSNLSPEISRAEWIVLARRETLFEPLDRAFGSKWQQPPLDLKLKPWRDDYSNLFAIWRR